ncbi:MAG: P-loop NTPase [Chloroflexota bacterium]|nr:P-loop NTPase [Chloroflexota bacterium]
MKLSICGKGGSGKSVLTVLVARALASRGYQVIVLDTDESNLGLQRMFGNEDKCVPVMTALGGKSLVREKLRATLTQKSDETEITVFNKSSITISDLPLECTAESQGIRLLSIGKIERPMEGCACPMGVLARDLVTKLQLEEREVLLVDTEAGVEHFGRGVESSVDVILAIVEPSFESVLLAERINKLAREMDIKAIAILNKMSEESGETLQSSLEHRGVPVAASIPYDQEVFLACLQGLPVKSDAAESSLYPMLESLGLS